MIKRERLAPRAAAMQKLPIAAPVLVVAGQCRGVGKTALVESMIRAFPEARWWAAKISPHAHAAWSGLENSPPRTAGAPRFWIEEEQLHHGKRDTARFLASGAVRSFLLTAEDLVEALPALARKLSGAKNVILESNEVLRSLQPRLCLFVLDPLREEFKSSAQRALGCADAFILRHSLDRACWQEIFMEEILQRPSFHQAIGQPLPGPLLEFVRGRFFG